MTENETSGKWVCDDDNTIILPNDDDKMSELVETEFDRGNLGEEFEDFIDGEICLTSEFIDNEGYMTSIYSDLKERFIESMVEDFKGDVGCDHDFGCLSFRWVDNERCKVGAIITVSTEFNGADGDGVKLIKEKLRQIVSTDVSQWEDVGKKNGWSVLYREVKVEDDDCNCSTVAEGKSNENNETHD